MLEFALPAGLLNTTTVTITGSLYTPDRVDQHGGQMQQQNPGPIPIELGCYIGEAGRTALRGAFPSVPWTPMNANPVSGGWFTVSAQVPVQSGAQSLYVEYVEIDVTQACSVAIYEVRAFAMPAFVTRPGTKRAHFS